MKKALAISCLLLAIACAKGTPPVPPEIAAFGSHLTYKGDANLATGTPGVRNHGRTWSVNLPFDEARKELTPILAKSGYVATPLIQAAGMKTVGFQKVKNENYALESFGTDPPGTCTLGYSKLY